MTFTITKLETERNFSKPLTIKNKFGSTLQEERLDFLSILSIKNDTTTSLSYEETIKDYAAKKIEEEKYYRVVSGS